MKKDLHPAALVTVGFTIAALAGLTVHAATELARINSSVITLEDFNKRYKDNLKYFQFKAPSRKNVLEDLIKRELAIQEARKMGLDKDPEIIERVNTVLYQALIERKLSKEFENIHVTDPEAREFYTKNPEIRTSHIFVALRPDASKEDEAKARARIQEIMDKHLKPGKMSFAEVAQRFSEGAAAPMGGDIDYQSRDKLDPAYYAEAMRLGSAGKVGGIIRSQFGFHIVKVTALRPWEEADKGQVKRMLIEEKRAQIFDKYMTDLRKQAKVTVRNDLLKD